MIVGVLNSKGGVGKTTVAVHLAAWLVEQGHSISFIDSDTQRSSAEWLGELDTKIPVKSVNTSSGLVDELQSQSESADFVIVDGPAGLSDVTRTIMLYANIVLFPCGPAALDLKAAFKAIGKLAEAQQIRTTSEAKIYFVPQQGATEPATEP